MWIYGSRAAGTQRPDDDPNPSDLDIAVDIDDMQESDSDTFRRGRFAD
jgi:predicted nucleotidyltransferase